MRQDKMIYMDYNATTPVDERVLECMLPYFTEKAGNASSRTHAFGWVADEAVEIARRQICAALQVGEKEIVFTSGATEAANLAIKGVFQSYHRKGKHLITVESEHSAVLDCHEKLERQGADVTYLKVDTNGLISLAALKNAIRSDTILVSIMWVNNETGVVQPMQEIAEICDEAGVLLFSDASQAVGKMPVHPKTIGVQLLSCSAHKFYGPKGTGLLFVQNKQPKVALTPQIDGGGHQRGLRSGTLSVPLIVGMGKAIELCAAEMSSFDQRLGDLRDRLEAGLLQHIEELTINGAGAKRIPNVSNITAKHVEGEKLIMKCNQKIAISSGSACTSASLDPSHVLVAMGREEQEAHGSVRISLGRYTTAADIDVAIETISEAVRQLREESPIWALYKQGIEV